MRVEQTFHSFYLLFVRTEASKVGSLAAAGVDAIVRADKRQPAGPADFSNPPDFCKSAKIFVNLLDYSWLQIFVYISSIYVLHSYKVCANINWRNCFDLRFKYDM